MCTSAIGEELNVAVFFHLQPDGPPKRNAMISIPQQPYQPQPPRPPPPPQQQQQATPQTNGAPGSRPTFQKQRSISEMLSFSEPESGPPSPKAMPSTQDQKPMYNPYEVDRKKQESTIIPSSPPPPPPAPPAPIAQSTSNNKNIPPPPPPPPPMMSFPQDEYTYNTENKHKSNKVKSALASLHKEKAEKLKSEEIEREQQVSEDIQTNNVDEMMPQYEQPIQNGVLSAEDQERLWREQQDFIEQQRRESMELSHQNSINQEMYGEQGRLAQSGQTQSSFDETDEMKAFEEAHRQANVSQELRKLEQPQEDLAQLQRQESRRREEEAIRKQEEEIRRYEEEKQRMVKEQEEKQKEEQLRAEEVMRIRQEEQRRREIEQQRFHEQQRILQEAQRRQQEDEQRRKEQEQRIIEEERARQAELQKQKDEEAKRQMAEQHRQRQAQERERILNNQRLEAERRESERQEKEESERRQQLLNSNSNQNNSRKELPKLMVNAAPPERHVHFNDELRKSYSPLSAYNSPFVLESMDHNEILPDEQNVNGDTQKLDPKDIYAETLRAKMNRQAINEAMERQRASLSPQPVQQNFQPNFTNDIRLNQNNNGQSPIINGISNQLSSNSSSPNEGVFEVPVNFIQKAANGPRMVSNSEDRISIMPNVAQPWSPTFNSNNGASIRSPPAPIASPPQAMSPPPKWTKPISPQPSRNVPVNYSWTPKKSDAPIKRNIPIKKIPATSNDQVPMSQAPQQSSLYYTMPGRPIGRNVAQTPPPIRQIPVQTMPTRTSRTPPPTRQAGFKNGNPYFQQNVNTNGKLIQSSILNLFNLAQEHKGLLLAISC